VKLKIIKLLAHVSEHVKSYYLHKVPVLEGKFIVVMDKANSVQMLCISVSFYNILHRILSVVTAFHCILTTVIPLHTRLYAGCHWLCASRQSPYLLLQVVPQCCTHYI